MLAWVPALLWTACVWSFGGAGFDASSTSRFLVPMLGWLMPFADSTQLLAVAGAVRKLGHPLEYGLLSLLVFRAAAHTGCGRTLVSAALALGWALALGAADELRQAGLPTRTGSLADLALDAIGATAGVALAAALSRPALEGGRDV